MSDRAQFEVTEATTFCSPPVVWFQWISYCAMILYLCLNYLISGVLNNLVVGLLVLSNIMFLFSGLISRVYNLARIFRRSYLPGKWGELVRCEDIAFRPVRDLGAARGYEISIFGNYNS